MTHVTSDLFLVAQEISLFFTGLETELNNLHASLTSSSYIKYAYDE